MNKAHPDSKTKWSKNGEALHIDTPEGIRQFIQHHKTNIQDAPWQKDRQAFAEAKAALTKTSDQMDGSTDGKVMDPYADNKRKFVDALGQLIENRAIYNSQHFQSLGNTTNERLKKIINFFQRKDNGSIKQKFKTLTQGSHQDILNLLRQIGSDKYVYGKPKIFTKPTPEELQKTSDKLTPNKTAAVKNNYGLMA